MKRRFALFPIVLALGVGAAACGQAQGGGGSEPAAGVSASQENLISATGNIMMWPAGPIAWNGSVGTWPISVWSSAPIGGLAFDAVGVTGLGCSVVGNAGLVAMPISTPYFDAFTAVTSPWLGAGAPLLGTAGVLAPAYGFDGAYAPYGVGNYGFGAYSASTGYYGATFADNALFPWLTAWTTPALTTSALMFNDLAVTDAMMPYTFNVTFTAPIAAQAAASQAAISAASLSIFATPIASAALAAGSVPFSSMVYPIMLPSTLAPLPAVAPALGAAAVAPVAPVVVPGVL